MSIPRWQAASTRRRHSCAPGAGCRGRRGSPARDAAWRCRIFHQPGGGGTDRRRLAAATGWASSSAWRRCALGMCSGMVVCPGRRSSRRWLATAAATMEHLHGLLGDAGLDHLAHQAIGHGVQVPLHLDVVVEPGAAATPLGVGVGFGRQRQQGGPLQALEQRLPAGAEMAHRPGIELDHQFADRARSVRPARTTGDGATGPAPIAAPPARPPRPWPCRAACAPAPAARRCRNAPPCPGRCG